MTNTTVPVHRHEFGGTPKELWTHCWVCHQALNDGRKYVTDWTIRGQYHQHGKSCRHIVDLYQSSRFVDGKWRRFSKQDMRRNTFGYLCMDCG